MAHAETATLQPDKLEIGGVATRIGVPALFVGVIALAIAVWVSFTKNSGTADNPTPYLSHFYYSYLAAYTFFMSLTLGALGFVLIHHLVRAGWSTTVRRIAEGLSLNIFLMVILIFPFFIPVNGETGAHRLLQWLSFDPTVPHGDDTLIANHGYLNPQFFAIRMGVYLVVWCLMAWFFASKSAQQDKDGNPRTSVLMEQAAKPLIYFYGFSLTAFAFDWIMSLNAHWYSTIFGVYYFASCMLSTFAAITLVVLALQRRGLIGNAVNHEHFQDLGKWMFAFTFFWGYVAFAQYMLIWYSNMPDETQFYTPRQFEGWAAVSLTLLFVHLVIPFPGLLSRHMKRRNRLLAFWAVWSVCACALDMFWLVVPNEFISRIPAEAARAKGTAANILPTSAFPKFADAHAIYHVNDPVLKSMIDFPLHAGPLAITALCFIGIGGLFIFSTMMALRGKSLVPTRDPRLNEALAFENI